MNNFNYDIPTKIIFGENTIEKLSEILKDYKNILLVYGGGSIKKIGLYDKIYEILKDKNIFECSGVEPNPRKESVDKGARICKENNVEAVLAVGGGSVIDCSKVIAACAKSDACAWDIVKGIAPIGDVLPIYSVLTLAATGSEMDGGAVITNLETQEKQPVGNYKMNPTCSILDPTYTFTVSKYQTAAGSIDIFSHLCEVYFDHKLDAFVTDRMMEGLLKTIIKYAPIAVKDPTNYEARSNLMWTSSLAINGLMDCGKEGCAWSCHPMEHSLSAYYDITHGTGLAILTPNWMEYILDEDTLDRFYVYGCNVWNLKGDKMKVAKESIRLTKQFFKDLEIPTTLREVNIDETHFEEMAKKACYANGHIYGFKTLDVNDVINIYKKSL